MGSMRRRGTDRRGLDVWELRVSLGFDAGSGTYPVYTEQYHGPRVNALRRLHELEDEREGGRLRRADVGTMRELLERWMERLPTLVKSRHTIQEYRRLADRVLIPKLGRIKPRTLTAEHVDDMLAAELSRGLAPESVAKVKTALSSALSDAQRRGIVRVNVARLSSPIAIPHRRITVLDEQATDNLLAYLAQNDAPWWQTVVGVAVTTGMRPSELLALRTDDVDLAEGTIEVQEGLEEDDAGVSAGDTKSARGRRRIRLHERTVRMLATWDLERDSLRRRYGRRWEEHNLIFPAVDVRGGHPGRLMRPHAITRRWARSRDDAGLPATMRFYDLRHSHATHLLHAGVNPKVVAERLGHDVTMTLTRYAFALPDMQEAAVDALGWLNLLR